ncbi:MAG: N-acetyl-gamma-glutamyl-phosphate reductase [Treponema sp. GWB1_62_6]|nr:MAG: N-acetyl-gamma-glutamyl-phosphate reductase [Treponema sp. GWC1_61_84]OHE71628.1 MAG: N-acetyl-gamma-glutamyl-phosphate reductase [Treponema sp. GWB1_62_6]OHE72752.1 MAG: N-acetyl-gamma-glutamyl-phosphate reductase [Treponema sp. RIFOXYC1_FULL_61_9]HCM26087.1 N-acetyl-gamma-glutamyl-phosphate reductase [Treponema sp.]
MKTAGIIGSTGYAGAELVRLLSAHPQIDRLVLSSTSFEGGRIEDVYPNLIGKVAAPLVSGEAVVADSDVVFSALPHGVGERFARLCMDKGIPFIDLSADFRFGDDEETFSAWYGKVWEARELHPKAVYGLPELNRAQIRGAAIVGNPGCYPTGASLALYPALKLGLIAGGTVIIDSASGVTGAGRSPSQATHFPDCSDSIAPYKVGDHRHVPEIARNLAIMAGRPVPLVFTPHLAPMNRGILTTAYAPLAAPVGSAAPASAPRPPNKEMLAVAASVRAAYAEFYKEEPFVRVLPSGAIASTRNVRASNYCDISVHIDQGGTTLIIVSAIDNMVKGAAGQAIQNMNIVLGFRETDGINAIPAAF